MVICNDEPSHTNYETYYSNTYSSNRTLSLWNKSFEIADYYVKSQCITVFFKQFFCRAHEKIIILVVVFDIDISDFYIWCQKRNQFNAWHSYHSAWFQKSIHQDFDCSKAWNLWYATEKYILPELSESCKSKIQQ